MISRAGKAGGRHKCWLNVKNIKTNAIKSIDFETIEEWNQIDDESIFTVDLSHGVIQAQKAELEKWKLNTSVYGLCDALCA